MYIQSKNYRKVTFIGSLLRFFLPALVNVFPMSSHFNFYLPFSNHTLECSGFDSGLHVQFPPVFGGIAGGRLFCKFPGEFPPQVC